MSLAAFLSLVTQALNKSGVPFMVTGSLASAYYGTPRATQDIDVVVSPTWEQLDRLVEELERTGLYVSREAAREAIEQSGQFNAIQADTGWKVDLIIRKDRLFSREEFEHRQPARLLGVDVALTSLEDLIIAKLEWSQLGDSELQRQDIVGLLNAGVPLDTAYVEKWVDELGLQDAWSALKDRLR